MCGADKIATVLDKHNFVLDNLKITILSMTMPDQVSPFLYPLYLEAAA